jgi:acyl dehydratase
MAALLFDDVTIGDTLAGVDVEPISRLDLALYCGASGDHNPIHVDIDYARAAGKPDVFAHGMLVMAHLGRAVTRWAPRSGLREFDVRFVQVTEVGDRLTCAGKVAAKFEVGGERRVCVELTVRDQEDRIKVRGTAVLALA